METCRSRRRYGGRRPDPHARRNGPALLLGGKIGNCEIHVVFKMRDENDNSGVFIRIPIEPREAWMPVHYGYEVQIDNHPEKSNEDEYHETGMLYSLTKPLVKNAWKPGPECGTRWISLCTAITQLSC